MDLNFFVLVKDHTPPHKFLLKITVSLRMSPLLVSFIFPTHKWSVQKNQKLIQLIILITHIVPVEAVLQTKPTLRG